MKPTEPKRKSYDVVIVGGAMIGTAVAWFLADSPDFDGTVLVLERDPSFEFAASSHSNSCIRQQFTCEINVKVSQFAAEYLKNFRSFMGGNPLVPELAIHEFGYMFLAGDRAGEQVLRDNQAVQAACGAATKLMSVDEISALYPFYNLDGILLGSHNLVDEGFFDGNALSDWWRRLAKERGVEFVTGEVTGMGLDRAGTRVETVTLATGEVLNVGAVVNASGARAARTCAMAGIDIPVQARKRYTYVFAAENPLDRDLPLTVDSSGVHVRTDGAFYMAGSPPKQDGPVDVTDFVADHELWEDKVWPAIATRIPQFEAIKVINSWVGHYAFNAFDQNAIVGAHGRVGNFYFANGFSGHGFQQAPAVGRGLAELIALNEYRSLDLSAFDFDRIAGYRPLVEKSVI